MDQDSPSPPTPFQRGVFIFPSPAGTVAIEAIDSTGHEFAQLRVAAAAYDDGLADGLRELLDRYDPVRSLRLLTPEPR